MTLYFVGRLLGLMNKFERETGRSRKLLSRPKALNILSRRNFPVGTSVTLRFDKALPALPVPYDFALASSSSLDRRIDMMILNNLAEARKVNAQGVVVVQEVDYAVLLMGHGPQSLAEGREIFENEAVDRLVGFPYTELKRLS